MLNIRAVLNCKRLITMLTDDDEGKIRSTKFICTKVELDPQYNVVVGSAVIVDALVVVEGVAAMVVVVVVAIVVATVIVVGVIVLVGIVEAKTSSRHNEAFTKTPK